MYGGIVTIAGEQLTLSSKGEVLVNGKERTSLQGKRISINPDDYGQAVVNGSLGVTRQLLVNGATYHEGEVYLHHITAPLEYQTTECADSLKCATLEPCLPPLEPEGVEILGATVPTIAWALKLVEWLVLHTHKMPPTQHFHYFKNIPLDLWCESKEVRIDACDSGINEPEQLPSKFAKTPDPCACHEPTKCNDKHTPCDESPNMPPKADTIP